MYKLGFIGMGNMGGSLVRGMLHGGKIKADDICGYDLNPTVMDRMRGLDVACLSDEKEVCLKSEIVFLCVKPQVIEKVVSTIKDELAEKAVVSIVLGYDFARYEKLLDSSTRHLTIMPNTPVEVNEGMLLLEEKHSLTATEEAYVNELFESIGEVQRLPSHLMGVGGALSGCGPAFIYMVIEALADGAVAKGLTREAAYKLASQTIVGSGKMQLNSGLHPGVLKDQVTSPGGSTIRGVAALEKGAIRSAFIEAIKEATGL